jgi:hypothetical protein
MAFLFLEGCMKFIELVEGDSQISSIFCWNLFQLNNNDYQMILEDVIKRKLEEIPKDMLDKISSLPYP